MWVLHHHVAASALVLTLFLLLNQLGARLIRKSNRNRSNQVLLSKLVAARNALAVATGTALLALWVKELESFILSIAALAGALLIVSKDLVTCWLGTAVRTFGRPFSIGDVIEIGVWSGKVVDSDLLTTTLLELGRANQFTGSRVELPNSLLLSNPVKNLSATGRYSLRLLTFPLAADTDLALASQALLAAARPVVDGYLADADEHLRGVETDNAVDLPSTELRVLIEPVDVSTTNLLLRFACPTERHASVEQAILAAAFAALRSAGVLQAARASSVSGVH